MLSLLVTNQDVLDAQSLRSARDARYTRNVYETTTRDERWVGELGEIVVCRHLDDVGITYDWYRDNPIGKADIRIGHSMVDVKTVKRQGPPRTGYTAQISAEQNLHADELLFLSYEVPTGRLWFIGGISVGDFLLRATRYEAGDQVHPHYRTRHAILNIPVKELTPYSDWLMGLQMMGAKHGVA